MHTPDTLIDNLDDLGPWSMFHLANIAMVHYFPVLLSNKDIANQIDIMHRITLNFDMRWDDWVIMYHFDVGYTPTQLNVHHVNAY
jgi:hypothetical protein